MIGRAIKRVVRFVGTVSEPFRLPAFIFKLNIGNSDKRLKFAQLRLTFRNELELTEDNKSTYFFFFILLLVELLNRF